MTRVKAGERRRAKAPKVRTGCKTCKVKCDEGQPACKRCTSTGRRCDGYESPQALPVVKSPRFVSLGPVLNIPEESRSLQYFYEKTVSQLVSFFQDDFWSSKVIQVANSDKGIWHSVIALSSYHEQFTGVTPKEETQDHFALKHYNLSIKGMLASERTSANAHIHLTSCILFICIELLRGNIIPAVRLVKAGYGILREQQMQSATGSNASSPSSPRSTQSSDIDGLYAYAYTFLSRIICQIYLLIRDTDPEMSGIVTSLIEENTYTQLPESGFSSLDEAHLEMNHFRLQLERLGVTEHLRAKYAAMCAAFAKFRSNNAAKLDTPMARRTVALLEVQLRYIQIELSVFSGPDDARAVLWDQHTDDFHKMMDLAEQAMGVHDTNEKFDRTPQFQVHTGIVPVLYAIIAKCRDPSIRRRAVGLMTARSLQEGMWNSKLVLGVVLRAMMVEEGGPLPPTSCEDIPAESRVRTISVAATGANEYMVGYELGQGWWWENVDNFRMDELVEPLD